MGFGRRAVAVLAGLWLLVSAVGVAVLGFRLLGALFTAPGLLSTLALVVVFSLALGYLSYRFGASRLLARIDAAPLTEAQAPRVHASLDTLAERMALDRPALYVSHLGQPNAFAIGSDTLVVDRSLGRLLTPDELEAILAHELAHLEGHDSLVRTVANSLIRTLTGIALFVCVPAVLFLTIACWGLSLLSGRPIRGPDSVGYGLRDTARRLVMSLLTAPTAALRAYSRRREYAADDRAVAVLDDPLALARALGTIQRATEPGFGLLSWLLPDDREPTRAERAFATHPPTDERIERVRAAARDRRADPSSGGAHRIEIN
jgi:heat shock protein HtpX